MSSTAGLCAALSHCSFLRGFLPGVLIGVFTSVLFFSLWQTHPISSVGVFSRRELFSSHDSEPGREPDSVTKLPATTSSELEKDTVDDGCGEKYLKSLSIEGAAAGFVLLLIHSTAGETSIREAVRETWLTRAAREHSSEYAARFVIGTKGLSPTQLSRLACENKHHRDLVLLPGVLDLYPDLPSSAKLLEAFRWAEANSQYSYILKCNSASYVVLDAILSFLKRHKSNGSLLWGYFSGNEEAERQGKFGEKNWYICNTLLPYPQGGGYVIGQDLVQMLVKMAPDLEPFEHDDIALGVWLAPFEGIERKHDVRFNTGYYSRGCNNAYLITHRETADSMREKAAFKNKDVLCEEEVQSRLSYVYDWSSAVSRCCLRRPGVP